MRILLACGLLAYVLQAQALDFRSVNAPVAVLYDAPSPQAKALSVVNRGYPFEVVLLQGKWAKVRDSSGTLAWVELSRLASVHRVVMRTAGDAHADADAKSPVRAHVAAGVILPWLGNVNGHWVKVKLPDASTAFIAMDQLWGA